jgi:hypothetical protein
MCPRHCADALLSLANNNTIVGQIAGALGDFASLWVQSPSSYDFLIGYAMRGEWTAAHKPVLSRAGAHTLYTTFKRSEPEGRLVICHRSCKAAVASKVRKNNVRFTCTACGSKCTTEKYTSNKGTLLGHYGLVKTAFPQEQYPTEWELPKPAEGREGSIEVETDVQAATLPHSTPSNTSPPPSITTDRHREHELPSSSSGVPPTTLADPPLPPQLRKSKSTLLTRPIIPLLRSRSLPQRQLPDEPPRHASPRLTRPQSIPLLGGPQATSSMIPSRPSGSSQTRASKRTVDKELDVKKKRPKVK